MFPRAIGKFISLEAFDMGLSLRRKGGKFVEQIFQRIKETTQRTAFYLGKFQRHQREGADIINKNLTAAADIQFRPMPVDRSSRLFPVRAGASLIFGRARDIAGLSQASKDTAYRKRVLKNKNGLPVSGTTAEGGAWVVDYIKDMTEGRIPTDNKGQQDIILYFRRAARITGRLYERIGMMNTIRKPDGSVETRLFKRTIGGRSFPTLMTTEFYAILMRGRGQPDKLWETNVEALIEISGKERSTIEKKMDRMRDMVMENDPQSGYRTVGAEYAREFHRHATALMSPSGVRVQIMHTNPRTVLDKIYTQAATRAGFIEIMGQDGKWVKRMKTGYVKGNGNPFLFDDAIRTLSDIPLRMTFLGGKVMPESPADAIYWSGRGALAMLEVYKQFLLSGTSLIQMGEPLAFSQFGYFKLAQAMVHGIRHPKMMADILMEKNVITRPLVDLAINREQGLIDIMNKMAGGLSRLHLNRIMNEIANEGLAGVQGYLAVNAMVKRGIDNKGNKQWEPRSVDFYNLHRILDFPADITDNILRGKGTSAQIHEAMRRAANFSTGSIALMAEKSPMRNSSIYRATVPFTGFFSNRIRGFAKNSLGWKDTAVEFNRASSENWRNPSPANLKKMQQARRQFATANLQLLKFTIGNQLAGIASTFLFSFYREGIREGAAQRWRELKDDPLGFLADAFMWGTFGPVYGAMHELSWRGATSEEDSATFLRRTGRFILPLSLSLDLRDMWIGIGPYKNRTGAERAARFFELHTPFFQVIPGQWVMGMLGMQMEDPAMQQAVKAAWTWRFNEKNNAVPAHGGTSATRTKNDKAIGILLRQGFEDLVEGREADSWIKFEEASQLSDIGQGPQLLIGGFLRSKIILNSPGMTDELRLNMLAVIGQNKYDLVSQRDDMLIEAMDAANAMYGEDSENAAWEKYFENQEYRDSHPILFPDPVP